MNIKTVNPNLKFSRMQQFVEEDGIFILQQNAPLLPLDGNILIIRRNENEISRAEMYSSETIQTNQIVLEDDDFLLHEATLKSPGDSKQLYFKAGDTTVRQLLKAVANGFEGTVLACNIGTNSVSVVEDHDTELTINTTYILEAAIANGNSL